MSSKSNIICKARHILSIQQIPQSTMKSNLKSALLTSCLIDADIICKFLQGNLSTDSRSFCAQSHVLFSSGSDLAEKDNTSCKKAVNSGWNLPWAKVLHFLPVKRFSPQVISPYAHMSVCMLVVFPSPGNLCLFRILFKEQCWYYLHIYPIKIL